MNYIISRLECKKLKVNKDVSFYRLICTIEDTSRKRLIKNIVYEFSPERINEVYQEIGIDMTHGIIDVIIEQATNLIFDYQYISKSYETWQNIKTELLNNHKDLIMKTWEDIEKYILEEPRNVK